MAVIIIISALLLLFVILLIKAGLTRKDAQGDQIHITVTPDYEQAQKNLAAAITFPTISHRDPKEVDWETFRSFRAWLEKSYPIVYEHLKVININEHTLLYMWEGSDNTLEPVLLTAHQDVVPAGDESTWKHPPFSGKIDEQYIWGRGTLDVKIQIIAILEAVQTLLSGGFQPQRAIHLCFGHDEEVGGYQGAQHGSAYLEEHGFHYAMVLDEGGAVTTGMLAGLHKPLATYGVAEKGYMDMRLTANSKGGHASMPGRDTALTRVAAAALDISRNRPKARLTTPVKSMFEYVAPHMKFMQRLILSNLWLFKGVILHLLGRVPSIDAMLRTTVAPTMASGSPAANVLPETASMILNLRLLPGDSCESVQQHTELILRRHPGVSLEILRADESSMISPVTGQAVSWLTQTISQVFPEAVIVPYLMAGSTDARKYERVSDAVYRFSPVALSKDHLALMHNSNERISLDNVRTAVDFYLNLCTRVGTGSGN
jgi:carboxypeptidase PM20D1